MKNIITYISIALFASFLMASTLPAAAQKPLSPVGTWASIDDKTNKMRSIIRITQHRGVLYGRILKVFKQPGDTGFCRKCTGRFKDKPVKGLQIMWGVKQTNRNTWSGGRILDPKNGKIYRVKLSISDNGRLLKVRGYIGISLFGRTQNWHRRK